MWRRIIKQLCLYLICIIMWLRRAPRAGRGCAPHCRGKGAGARAGEARHQAQAWEGGWGAERDPKSWGPSPRGDPRPPPSRREFRAALRTRRHQQKPGLHPLVKEVGQRARPGPAGAMGYSGWATRGPVPCLRGPAEGAGVPGREKVGGEEGLSDSLAEKPPRETARGDTCSLLCPPPGSSLHTHVVVYPHTVRPSACLSTHLSLHSRLPEDPLGARQPPPPDPLTHLGSCLPRPVPSRPWFHSDPCPTGRPVLEPSPAQPTPRRSPPWGTRRQYLERE